MRSNEKYRQDSLSPTWKKMKWWREGKKEGQIEWYYVTLILYVLYSFFSFGEKTLIDGDGYVFGVGWRHISSVLDLLRATSSDGTLKNFKKVLKKFIATKLKTINIHISILELPILQYLQDIFNRHLVALTALW